MLVVTANWSIGDGTVHGPPPRGSVEAFLRELRRAAWRAGFRGDGRYRPVDGVEIVLAGDTFDGLASFSWQGGSRPWHGGLRICRESDRDRDVADRIAAAAIRQGRRLLAALGRLRRDGLDVPRADSRGRPMPGTMRRAPVAISCLLGDRDRMLDVARLAALAARHGIAIGTEQASDALVIRHGDECDPVCGHPGVLRRDRGPTLAESLVVDLMVEFARRLRGTVTPSAVTAGLVRRLARAPSLEAPRHLAAWLTDCGPAWRESGRLVRETWRHATDHWHRHARATPPEVAEEHDVVDAVAAWMEAAAGHTGRDGLRPDPVIERLLPRFTAPSAGSRGLVLGHPSPDAVVAPAAGQASCICLGSSRRREYDFGSRDGIPRAVVFPDATATHAEWLSDGSIAGFVPEPVLSVARIGTPRDEPGIVDAA
ncbi:MAG: hypothetical protein ACKOYJ_08605 [Planctomycetia bacterium]